MIPVEQCRELIPDSEKLTDEEILCIREDFYSLAALALENYPDIKKNKSSE